jgi:hypothetical protein
MRRIPTMPSTWYSGSRRRTRTGMWGRVTSPSPCATTVRWLSMTAVQLRKGLHRLLVTSCPMIRLVLMLRVKSPGLCLQARLTISPQADRQRSTRQAARWLLPRLVLIPIHRRHPASALDVNDVFTYTLKDCDGDISTANLSVSVGSDDQPVVVNGYNWVDETGGFDTVTGTVSVNYGADGPG